MDSGLDSLNLVIRFAERLEFLKIRSLKCIFPRLRGRNYLGSIEFKQRTQAVLAEDGFSEVAKDMESGPREGLDRPGSGFSPFPEVRSVLLKKFFYVFL